MILIKYAFKQMDSVIIAVQSIGIILVATNNH